jgi:site-specific DNA recombinase
MPLGYRNVTGADGKKVIAVDPDIAALISKLFELNGTRLASMRSRRSPKRRAAGLVYRKSGSPVPTSTVHSILRNRLYTGDFEWSGKLHHGHHEPLVSVELWDRVQAVMDGRSAKKAAPHEARLRLFGPDRLRQVTAARLSASQEAALHLLSLHRLRG